jgi:hypothetical protein
MKSNSVQFFGGQPVYRIQQAAHDVKMTYQWLHYFSYFLQTSMQTADLSLVFKDSSPTCPLIFVLSTGTDPAADLYKFAEEMRFSKKLNAISLGQGQGSRAEAMMRSAMERGKWVFFQNCHLSPSWMPSLEGLIENIDVDKVKL